MKKILLSLALLTVSVCLNAQDVPEYLKDGEITVTLKNGQSYTFQSNEFKIVNRAADSVKEEKKISKEPASVEPQTVASEPSKSGKFTFSIIPQVGVGPDGVKTSSVPGGYSNEADRKAVFGATLCGGSSNIFAKFCGSAFTNRLYTLGLGMDF